MLVTVEGMTMLLTAEQQLKAKSPMLVIPSGSDTEVMWLLKPKAILPRCRTCSGTLTEPETPVGTMQSVRLSLL